MLHNHSMTEQGRTNDKTRNICFSFWTNIKVKWYSTCIYYVKGKGSTGKRQLYNIFTQLYINLIYILLSSPVFEDVSLNEYKPKCMGEGISIRMKNRHEIRYFRCI